MYQKHERNRNKMTNPNPQNKFEKGQPSPNPKGRPKKGYSITEMMQELIASKVKDKKTGKMVEVRKALGNSILKKALEGDTAAQRIIWNYMDGMPFQSTDVTSGGDKIEGLVVYRPKKNE